MTRIYGIDLGTTYTKCALAHRPDHVEIFKLDRDPSSSIEQNSLSVLRSAVSVTTTRDGTKVAYVGQMSAKVVEDWDEGDPEIHRFEEAKMWIGERVTEQVGDPPPWSFAPHRWDYRPEDVGALVLRKVKKEVEDARGPELTRAVITHPNYFTDTRREATLHAARVAGIEVVATLTEPDAAAVAYGVDAAPGKYMIFDLGGGTLDVTVAEIDAHRLEILGVDGLKIGGRDFDRLILHRMFNAYKATYESFDPSFLDRKTKQVWMRKAEIAKIDLCNPTREKSVVRYACMNDVFEGQEGRLVIKRDELVDDAQKLVESCIACADSARGRANLQWSDLTEIICVGGSTRLTSLRDALEKACGKRLRTQIDPDTAVAHGAAVHAHRLEQAEVATATVQVPGTVVENETSIAIDVEMRGVLTRGLGVKAHDPNRGGDIVRNLVPRGERLPCTARGVFHTRRDNQRSLEVDLYEGEDLDPEDCTMIGKVVFTDLPAAKAGAAVVVTIKIDANQGKHLIVSASGRQREERINFDPTCVLAADAIEERREFVASLVIL